MRIELPFPDRKMSPNYHAHWRAKEKVRQEVVRDAAILTMLEMQRQPFFRAETYAMTITFCPPDRRQRDIDNLHAACKHYLDGICSALEINDRQIKHVNLKFGEVCKPGAAIVDIYPLGGAQ